MLPFYIYYFHFDIVVLVDCDIFWYLNTHGVDVINFHKGKFGVLTFKNVSNTL